MHNSNTNKSIYCKNMNQNPRNMQQVFMSPNAKRHNFNPFLTQENYKQSQNLSENEAFKDLINYQIGKKVP